MKTQLTSSESYWYEYITDGGLINKNEAKEIMETMGFHSRTRLADSLASYQAGDTVGYAVSYNINYSNYCSASCPICAFYVPAKLKGKTDRGYELTEEQVRAEARKAKALQ